jgi:hypothetical protein
MVTSLAGHLRGRRKLLFGAMGNAFELEWKGMMAWVFPPADQAVWAKVVEYMGRASDTEIPTRFLVVLEGSDRVLEGLRGLQVNAVCSFSAGEFPLLDPRAFQRAKHQRLGRRSPYNVRVVMVENKEARVKFPVLWKALLGELERWSFEHKVDCRLSSDQTDPIHRPLSAWWRRYNGQISWKDNKLNWFDNCSTSATRLVVLQRHADERVQSALDQVAKFDRYAGALGLLPRGLRSLVSRRVEKPTKKQREMDSWRMEELSRTVFTGTFRIWMERRRRGYAWWRHKQEQAPKRKRQGGHRRLGKKQKIKETEVKSKPTRSSARLAARQPLPIRRCARSPAGGAEL